MCKRCVKTYSTSQNSHPLNKVRWKNFPIIAWHTYCKHIEISKKCIYVLRMAETSGKTTRFCNGRLTDYRRFWTLGPPVAATVITRIQPWNWKFGQKMQSNGVWLTLASLVAKVWLETRAMQTRLRKQSRSCWVTFLKVQGLLKFANKWLHTEANCEQKTGTLSWTNQLPCSSHRSGGSWTRSWCSWEIMSSVANEHIKLLERRATARPLMEYWYHQWHRDFVTKQKSKAAGF